MSVLMPSKITTKVLDFENLFSLIQILGNKALGRYVHGGGCTVVGVPYSGGAVEVNDWQALKK